MLRRTVIGLGLPMIKPRNTGGKSPGSALDIGPQAGSVTLPEGNPAAKALGLPSGEVSIEELKARSPDAVSLAAQAVVSMTGRTPFNPDEHFLLCDLDPAKDAIIFGYDREEFYSNVKKMKEVIINYDRWEKNDNRYIWGTRLVQFVCFCVAMDITRNIHAKLVLRDGLVGFIELSNEDINSLQSKRQEAMEKLKQEFVAHPPSFATVKRKEATVMKHPMDTLHREEAKQQQESERVREALDSMGADPFSKTITYAASPTAIPALIAARRVLLPQIEDFTSVVKEEILDYQKAKRAKMRHPAVNQ